MKFPLIDHHGAVSGVTAWSHQLHAEASNSYLIDFGLLPGAEATSSGKAGQGSLDIDTIKALIATQVHVDHAGRIPYLLAGGFKGPIALQRTFGQTPAHRAGRCLHTRCQPGPEAGRALCKTDRTTHRRVALLNQVHHA